MTMTGSSGGGRRGALLFSLPLLRRWLRGVRRRTTTWEQQDSARPDHRAVHRVALLHTLWQLAGNYNSPGRIMELLESAAFCIQPRGDSYTRKSTFDSMLAGCIPVFLHPASAYTQYTWHLPRDYRSYSVFIPHTDVAGRNASIEAALRRIPAATVARMREEVIRLIPRITYRDPAATLVKFRDAFDIAVDAVLDRVARRRRAAAEGREYVDVFDGHDSWKHNLLEDGQMQIGPHEFDPYL